MKKFKNFFLPKISALNKKRKEIAKKALIFIQKKPFTSFFAVLAIFFILMVIGNLLFSPKIVPEQNLNLPKKIQVYKLGSSPQVTYQGKVEKSGVIKIVAQTSGIVSSINVTEGQEVFVGTNILSLSTNYSGGNASSISRQIAQNQYQNTKDTFDSQKSLIQVQRDLANKNKDNAGELRDITNKSVEDTQNLVNLDQSIVDTLNQNLLSLVPSDPLYLQTKEQISQFQSAVVQLNGSLRSLQYQGAGDKPPADLVNIQKDITVRSLDLQEKALNMNLEISRLSYNLALVYESNMFPSSPFAGVVDKIFVHVGDKVSADTILASISGTDQNVKIVVSVPFNIAKNISIVQPSVLYIGKKNFEMVPSYISKDATNGVLYSVIYQLDNLFASELTDATYVNVEIPIGVANTTNIDPYIPLDSVVQTQEEAFVYVFDNGIAKVRMITLGQIQGRFVEVLSGLPKESQVILNRNVIEGDKVSVAR